jgi:transcriptional regulator with XRE-family HTH domain
MKVGKYLRKMRIKENLSQTEMGRLIGKRPVRISEWENDKYGIKLGEFLEIAKALKIKNINSIFKD